MNKGVSIVICCYNSAKILPETLKYVCNLNVSEEILWEVIIIDNASDDNTSEAAKSLLNEYKCPVPFKIIYQPVQGLSSARKMGLENSKYEYILFCDDDNWLNENYLETGFSLMESNSEIGVLGGYSEAVTETKIPEWFYEFRQNYSIGNQSEITGDITWITGVLWGAGMIVRKQALKELFSKGFKSLLTDRKKNQLSSGGDSEFCYALRLAGWKIWYDPKLKLKHYISQERLAWKYLRKLNRGFGAQKVDFDPYLKVFEEGLNDNKNSKKQNWQTEALMLIKKLRGYGFRKLIKFNSSPEGDSDILRIEKSLGRLQKLLKIRGKYDERIKLVKNASWRKVFSVNEIHFI